MAGLLPPDGPFRRQDGGGVLKHSRPRQDIDPKWIGCGASPS